MIPWNVDTFRGASLYTPCMPNQHPLREFWLIKQALCACINNARAMWVPRCAQRPAISLMHHLSRRLKQQPRGQMTPPPHTHTNPLQDMVRKHGHLFFSSQTLAESTWNRVEADTAGNKMHSDNREIEVTLQSHLVVSATASPNNSEATRPTLSREH